MKENTLLNPRLLYEKMANFIFYINKTINI